MQFDTASHNDDWLKPLFNDDAPRSTSTAAPVPAVPVEPTAAPTTIAAAPSRFEQIRKIGRRISRRHVAAALAGAGVAALVALVIIWHHARDVAVDAAGKLKPVHADVVPARSVPAAVKPSAPASPAATPTPSKAEHLRPSPWSTQAAQTKPSKLLPAIEAPPFLKVDLQKIHANLTNGSAGNSDATPTNGFGRVANPWNDMFPDSAANNGSKRTPAKTN